MGGERRGTRLAAPKSANGVVRRTRRLSRHNPTVGEITHLWNGRGGGDAAEGMQRMQQQSSGSTSSAAGTAEAMMKRMPARPPPPRSYGSASGGVPGRWRRGEEGGYCSLLLHINMQHKKPILPQRGVIQWQKSRPSLS